MPTVSDVAELPPLATKKQAAEWAGVSERHIDNLVPDGKFTKPIRVGSRPRWRRSDLLNWLESQATAEA